MDDGSRDGTARILAGRAAADSRVRVLTQEALGIVPALERARAAARGTWLARMDGDDRARPSRLARQLERAEEDPEVVAVGCGVRYFPRDRVRDGTRRYETWINALVTPEEIARDLFVECPLAHPTFFLRAEAVEAVGGYRDPGWPEDYDLLLRLWEAGGRLCKVPEVLLEWRERPDRLHRTHPRYAPEAFRRCKIHFLRRTLLRDRDGVLLWGAGPTGKAFARTLLDEGVELRAFVDLDPRKIGQEIHGAPVVSPTGAKRFRGSLALAAVAQEGGRAEIRRHLEGRGWREGEDFVAVA